MFNTAKHFSTAAWCLNKEVQNSSNGKLLLIPSQVLAAFTLELYLKTLYYLINGKEFTDNGKNTHNLYKIFQSLEGPLKKSLAFNFSLKAKINTSTMSRLEEIIGDEIPADLEGNLEAWSNLFVRLRYPYELEDQGWVYALFFAEIEEVLLDSIHEINPELRRQSNPLNVLKKEGRWNILASRPDQSPAKTRPEPGRGGPEPA